MRSFLIRVGSTNKRGGARHARSLLAAIIVCAMFGPASGATTAGDRSARPQSAATSAELTSSSHGLAQEQVIWTFQGSPNDGATPYATLIADGQGALYGTTQGGGSTSCTGLGCGTVYKLTPMGSGYSESVLYNFQGPPGDGQYPVAALVADANGVLYGTTSLGGSPTCATGQGCGTVFKLTPSGSGYSETVIYYFQNTNDGSNPQASLILDNSGALYGTAASGGAFGNGTAFKLTPTKSGYMENTLHAFKGGTTDGASPSSNLVVDKRGALVGETFVGGKQGWGTAFKLTPAKSGYAESVLYSFKNTRDGAYPKGGLLVDSTGRLIGTTTTRGTSGGGGTVFRLSSTPSGYSETTLHNFAGRQDGKYPDSGVIADATGALYGTTFQGGPGRHGTVFKLTPSGSTYTETVLYDVGGSTGAGVIAGLLIDSTGSLYGSTYRGPYGSGPGVGTVFKVTQ
jgi:uncharacterized repeat protein (TIGR03803 family)